MHGDHGDHDHDHDHDHHHGHDHGHSHPPLQPDEDAGPASPYEILETALRELLAEKGIISPDELHAQMNAQASRTPALGAKVIAKAWTDPAYKARLMSDARGALMDLGIDFGAVADLMAVENTAQVHNVVVCTLCSCYPRGLLGVPPAWYKSRAYRSRVVHEPRAVLSEFGVDLPDDIEVRVLDSTADLRYLVVPQRPAGTEGWSEDELAALVTRDSMVGTGVPRPAPRA
jgi:nitrile hydratase